MPTSLPPRKQRVFYLTFFNMKRRIEKEFVDANILKASVEHNGFQGGDAGHGGYVKINFTNLAGTDMFCNGLKTNGFSFEFKGDAERRTLVESLKMIVTELVSNTELNDAEPSKTEQIAQLLYTAIWINSHDKSMETIDVFITEFNIYCKQINHDYFFNFFRNEPDAIKRFIGFLLQSIKREFINKKSLISDIAYIRKQLHA